MSASAGEPQLGALGRAGEVVLRPVGSPQLRSSPQSWYVALLRRRSRTWHTDPDCPSLARSAVTARTARAALVAVAAAQRDLGLLPCLRCARPQLLDEVAAGATGDGYHWLLCDGPHGPAGCAGCAYLAGYAHLSSALVGYLDGRVAILRSGVSDLSHSALASLRVGVYSVSNTWGELPDVNALVWSAAAVLIGRGTAPRVALAAAAGLHTPLGVSQVAP